MLLQFAAENYRSISSETVLNLAPAKSRIHTDHVLISDEAGRSVKSLPLAVLYGANASGKSNLIRALSTARQIVISPKRGGSAVPVTPFLLDPATTTKPSRFEFVLKHEGVLYTYGFSATSEEIIEEWLFAVFDRKEVKVYERVSQDGAILVEPGRKLAPTQRERERVSFIAEGLQPNQLFLTEAAERNIELLMPLIWWFRHSLEIISPRAAYQLLLARAFEDKSFSSFLQRFLQAADTGIEGLHVEVADEDGDEILSKQPDSVAKRLRERLERRDTVLIRVGGRMLGLRRLEDGSIETLALSFSHRTSDGSLVRFDPEQESDGTNRMMHLAPALLNLEQTQSVYVIDELDRSLHPSLCRAFVRAFLQGITERGCSGQLIVTTHDTGLLDLELLRRDEIWFVEKDREGASHLSSLAEFNVRSDLRIDKGYINGRFGAIPFVGDMARLFPEGGCD